jgi:excisionase family DNA binding protein
VSEIETFEPSEPGALSPGGAARYLAISRRGVYELINSGQLIARKSGARTFVDFLSIKTYLAALPVIARKPKPPKPEPVRAANTHVSTAEACRLISCNETHLRILIRTGQLPHIREKGRLKIAVRDLAKLIDNGTQWTPKPKRKAPRLTVNKRVTVAACCAHLGVDEHTLRSMLMSGRLPYIRKRDRLLIKIADLDRYLEDTRTDRPPGASDDD